MSVVPRPEVAARLHELRFTRFLSLDADIPKVKGKCAWCGKESSLKYCCNECTAEAHIRRGDTVGSEVFKRDHGICAECGIDTDSLDLMRVYLSLRPFLICTGDCVRVMRKWHYPKWIQDQWGPWWPGRGDLQMWQADHIIPVIEGGGCCGLDNYQTLCTRCHKEDTKELAGRTSRRRRAEKRMIGPQMEMAL